MKWILIYNLIQDDILKEKKNIYFEKKKKKKKISLQGIKNNSNITYLTLRVRASRLRSRKWL